MAAYDAIAGQYAQVKDNDVVDEYAVYPSFYSAIGAIRGKSVLDLACGEGRVSRKMAALGASYVLGVDISKEMLDIARSRCPTHAPIEYLKARVGHLGSFGNFDIITAAWLLHYAGSRDELFRMCKDIAANLAPHGTYVGINSNPWTPLCSSEKYGFTVTAESEILKDADPMDVTIFGNGAKASFRTHYWSWKTYQEAMLAAGLSVEPINIKPTREGYRAMGANFWDDFLKAPPGIIFKVRHAH